MISAAAQKVLDYLHLYKVSPTEYQQHLDNSPKASARGAFADSLTELVAYEATYGYFPIS